MLHVLGEQTGMKLSCIKPTSKVRGLSIEPRSSTGCIDYCMYIDNTNMRRYITSASGHELSGCVRAHAYNYYAWAERAWVAK